MYMQEKWNQEDCCEKMGKFLKRLIQIFQETSCRKKS